MPKLPGIDYNRPVQSLGRESPTAPIRTAGAEAYAAHIEGAGLIATGKVATQLGGYLQEQEERYAQHEAQMAVVAASKEMQDITARRLGQKNVPETEVPKSIMESVRPGYYDANTDGDIEFVDVPEVKYHEHALEFYDHDAKTVGEKYLANLKTRTAREAFTLAWSKASVRGRGPVINDAIQVARLETKAQAMVAAQDLAEDGNFPGAARLIRSHSPDIFSPVEAQQHINNLRGTAAMAPIQNAIAKGDMMTMEAMVADLKSEGYAGPLTPRERVTTVQSLENRIAQVKAGVKAEKAHENAKTAAALKIGVDNGTITHNALNQAHDQNIITDSQFISWSSQLNDNIRKQVEGMEMFTRFGESIQTQTPIDDSDTDTKKALNKYWGGPLGKSYDGAKMLITNSNVVPSDATQKMLMDANSNDTKAMLQAATFYNDIEDAAKLHVFKGIDGKVGDRLRMVASMLRNGYTPDRIELEMRRVESITPSARAELASDADTQQQLTGFRDWFKDQYSLFFAIGEEDPPAEMMGLAVKEYKRQYLTNGGNDELARTATKGVMDKIWARTEANPNGAMHIMRHAPERTFALDGAMIRADVRDFATPWASSLDGVHANETYLVADRFTNESPTRNGWALFYVDDLGNPRQFQDARTGMGVRYITTRDDIFRRQVTEPKERELEIARRIAAGESAQTVSEDFPEFTVPRLGVTPEAITRARETLTPMFQPDEP